MTKYPQGGERQLIYATTGRAINSKMLPADAGCIVDNVETIIAVYNLSLIHIYFTVKENLYCRNQKLCTSCELSCILYESDV